MSRKASLSALQGLDKRTRREVWFEASLKCLKHPLAWLAILFCIVTCTLGRHMGLHYLGGDTLGRMTGTAVGGGLGGLVFGLVINRLAPRHLAPLLRARNRCVQCGYNLYASTTDNCPECGADKRA